MKRGPEGAADRRGGLRRASPVNAHSPLFYVHWGSARGHGGASRRVSPSGRPTSPAGSSRWMASRCTPARWRYSHRAKPSSFRAEHRAIVMLLGGEPVGPRLIEWNFVASTKDRLEQAKADWRAGRMKLPDADDKEFIPLPATRRRPPTR